MKALILFLLLFTSNINAEVDSYTSESLGVSIDIPTINPIESQEIYVIADFFLPSKGAFSSNIGIQKQKFKGSLNDYNELSLSQFKSAGWTVIKFKKILNGLLWEYVGSMFGHDLHWYAKAIKKGDYIYLVTATALSSEWESQKDVLKKSIDSFKVK